MQAERDQLKPEHLVQLHNPESRVSKEPSQLTHLTVGPGGILVGADKSSNTWTSAFVKTIPNIAALAQIWLVYITIQVHATGNLTLNEALLAYLEHLIECDHLYQWWAVADYHLAVSPALDHNPPHPSSPRTGWAEPLLQQALLTPATSSTQANHALAAAATMLACTVNKSTHDAMSVAHWQGYCHPSLQEDSIMRPTALYSPGQCLTTPSLCPPLATLPAGIIDLLPDLAADCLLSLIAGSSPPLPRLNTWCELPIFDATDIPAMRGTLQHRLWSTFLDLYPNQAFASQLQGALRHGVKLGYKGPLHHNACLDVVNLPMDSNDIHHLHCEIDTRLMEGRLCHVAEPINSRLVCTPVGVIPKPHSDKRQTIYHLSHPRKPGNRLPSINDGIHTSFVTIHYESLDAIMAFIHDHPSTSLWKADLEDAF
ncbi:hypothetical protein NDA18_002853 [Ustilago nuda]|nr:hypothetical protein NDA18_002853 [Ustilago nuda]